jgi:hypothetical protein
VRFSVIAVDGQDGLSLLGGTTGLAAGGEHVAEIEAGRDVSGLEIDGAKQLRIGRHHGAGFEIRLCQLIVGGGKVLVDLEGVGELNLRLLVFALIGVALAALEILLFLDTGIAMSTKGGA